MASSSSSSSSIWSKMNFFRSGMTSLTSGGSKQSTIDPDDIDSVTSLQDCVAVMRRAVEVKKVDQSIKAMEATCRIIDIESDKLSININSDDNPITIELGNLGICLYIDQILGSSLAQTDVCESSLKLIVQLISSSSLNRQKFANIGCSYRIVKAIQLHASNEKLMELAVDVMRYLSLEDDIVPKLVSCNSCEVLCQVLKTHTTNDRIVQFTCRCIYNLTYDNDESKDKFITAGICDTLILKVMSQEKINNIDINVAKWSLRAIGGLGRRHEENIKKLTDVGTCELVIQKLLYFKNEQVTSTSNLSTEQIEELAEAGSWAIANLSYPNKENQTRFAALGAVDLILGYLKEFIKNASVVRESLRAIRSLSHDNADNLKLINKADGSEIVVSVIREHNSDFETVQWGWFAVATLSSDEQSLPSWGAAGACDQIVLTLTRFSGNSDVVLWACMALSKLAVDADNCASLGQIEGGKLHVAIMRAIMAHADKVEILEEICCSTSFLAVNQVNASRLIDTGCANVILSALKKHPTSEAVANQGLKALRQLMIGGDSKIIAKIASENGCSIIPKTFNKLFSNMLVSQYAIEIIGILAYNDVNREKLVASNAINGLIEAMQMHILNVDLVLSGLRAVSQLCLCNAVGLKFSSSNYFAVLVKVLRMILRISSEDKNYEVETRRVIVELCMSIIRDQASYQGLSAKFINEGCADVMVGILQHFMADASIVSSTCSTFSTLAGSNKKTLLMDSTVDQTVTSMIEQIGTTGACEMIMKALEVHAESIQVVIPCLDAVHSLSITSTIRQRFGNFGVPAAVMRSYSLHSKTMGIIEIACSAIGSLAMNDCGSSFSNQSELGEFGACEAVSDILNNYQDSAMVCEAACRAISCLADGHEMNQNKFMTAGTCEIVFNILKKFSTSIPTAVQALLAISSLGKSHDVNSDFFGRFMISDEIFNIFNKNPTDSSIIEACCRVIYSLKTLMQAFGDIGFCNILGSALNLHTKKENAALWICKAITILAHLHKNRIALSKQGACEAVTATIKGYASNESLISVVMMRNTGSTAVTQCACEALYFLIIDPAKISDEGVYLESSESDAILEEFQKVALQSGACDAVAKALGKYGEIESVSYSCCRTIWALCYGSEATQAKFGSLGVCSYISETLQMFPSSTNVARWGCRAVGLMAKNNEANVNRLLSAGICEILPAAMQSHQSNPAVAESCCEAIANLSSSASQSLLARLGQSGACESIVGALQKHSVSNGLVLSACHAIANLSVTKGNASWLGATGACETMLRNVLLHSSDQLTCAIAWKAVGNLCSDDDNRFRLGNIGACEAILESLSRHNQSIDINNWGAYAIARLIERESSSDGAVNTGRSDSPVNIEPHVSNVFKLSSNRCSEILVTALSKHSHNQNAAFNICQAIAVLARIGGLTESQKMGSFGACNAVIVAMKQHEDKENVCWSGACALRSLSVNNYENQEKIGEVGGCAVLAKLLVTHKVSNDAVEALSAAISNICANDITYNKQQLGDAGACENLLAALELYQKNAETSLWIASSLEQLCYNNEENMRKVAFASNCGDLIVSVLQRFMDKEIFPTIICSLMIELCADRVGQHKLSNAGACKAVVNLLLRGAIGGVGGVIEQRSDAVVKLIMTLFSALCGRSPENQNKLGQAGACKAASSVLEKHLSGAMNSVSYFTDGATTSPIIQSNNDSVATKLSKKVTDIVSKRMTLIVTEAMRAVSSTNSLDSVDPHSSTSAGRYIVVIETCHAIMALIQDNPTNRSKVFSTGIADVMTSFINGGYGFIEDDHEKGEKLRNIITETLVAISISAGKE